MKTQEMIKALEKEGYKIIKDNSWLKIPELNIEVEIEVHDKGKSWNELGLKDKEKELLTYGQCMFLANNKKYAKILKMDGSSSQDDFFIQQPFELNRKNGYVARFDAVSDCAYLGCRVYSDYSVATLGVRFKKPIKSEDDND